MSIPANSTVGLLLGGGLNSAILLGTLVERNCRVQPFYVRLHLMWETAALSFIDNDFVTGPRSSLMAVGCSLAAIPHRACHTNPRRSLILSFGCLGGKVRRERQIAHRSRNKEAF